MFLRFHFLLGFKNHSFCLVKRLNLGGSLFILRQTALAFLGVMGWGEIRLVTKNQWAHGVQLTCEQQGVLGCELERLKHDTLRYSHMAENFPFTVIES